MGLRNQLWEWAEADQENINDNQDEHGQLDVDQDENENQKQDKQTQTDENSKEIRRSSKTRGGKGVEDHDQGDTAQIIAAVCGNKDTSDVLLGHHFNNLLSAKN